MEVITSPSELAKLCEFSNKEYRAQRLYKIVNKSGVTVPLLKNPIQKQIDQSKSKRKLILKARQFGVTTNEVIKMLDFVLWNDNKTACILAHEQDAIKKIFKIARYAYKCLPYPFQMELEKGGGSLYEMRFSHNNSKIYCDLESRGDTIHWLHISEAAFIDDSSRVIATMQAVPIDGIITFESTPNGLGNWFYDLWSDPTQNYDKIFCPWFFHAEYAIDCGELELTDEEVNLVGYAKQKHGLSLSHAQISFRRAKQAELKQLFRQEYPEDDQTCFLSSGNAAIDPESVKEMRDNARAPIYQKDGLTVFEKVNKVKRYVIGVDTAEGSGGDYSVATVFEVKTKTQVAILRGHFKPYAFAHRIKELAELYTTVKATLPMVAVERNNHGHAVLLEMYEHIRYPNIFQDDDDKLGWLTDKISRPMMIDAFIDGVENQRIQLNCQNTFQECLTLVEYDGRIEAGKNKNDDCVIACAIALQLCIQQSNELPYTDIGAMIRV